MDDEEQRWKQRAAEIERKYKEVERAIESWRDGLAKMVGQLPPVGAAMEQAQKHFDDQLKHLQDTINNMGWPGDGATPAGRDRP